MFLIWIIFFILAGIGAFFSLCFLIVLIGTPLGLSNIREIFSSSKSTFRTKSTWEWMTRRLLVLDSYCWNTENFYKCLDEPGFLTNEWIEKWYGESLPDYMIKDLNEIENP